MNKQNNVLELFYNEPTKHWHFKEIVDNADISDQRANFWLKRLKRERIIRRVKPRGRMPYYIAEYDNIAYKNKKKLFALNKMERTGLLDQLASIKARTVVLFGSFSRSDWHKHSDVDIFIYGEPGELESGTIWEGRDLEVHTCRTREEIDEIRSGLINNVIKGFFIRGNPLDLLR